MGSGACFGGGVAKPEAKPRLNPNVPAKEDMMSDQEPRGSGLLRVDETAESHDPLVSAEPPGGKGEVASAGPLEGRGEAALRDADTHLLELPSVGETLRAKLLPNNGHEPQGGAITTVSPHISPQIVAAMGCDSDSDGFCLPHPDVTDGAAPSLQLAHCPKRRVCFSDEVPGGLLEEVFERPSYKNERPLARGFAEAVSILRLPANAIQPRRGVTYFSIDVAPRPDACTAPWRVSRRYSEFLELKKALEKVQPMRRCLTPFPAKHFITSCTGALLEERRRTLEFWLRNAYARACGDRQSRWNSALRRFLEAEAHEVTDGTLAVSELHVCHGLDRPPQEAMTFKQYEERAGSKIKWRNAPMEL